MPRRARLEVPGIPLHITQPGVNRGAVFVDNQDRRLYLDLLYKMTVAHEVAVHAYVLMGNHVRLLTTASEAGAISMVMRRLGQCYAQSFNRTAFSVSPGNINCAPLCGSMNGASHRHDCTVES